MEKLLNRIKLTKSLRIVFVFAFFIPFVILSTLYTCILYNTMKKWELNRVQSNLEVVEQSLSRIMQNVTLVSDRIYVNRRLKKILLSDYSDIQQLYEDYTNLSFLEDYLHTYKEISSFRIYTKNHGRKRQKFTKANKK